MLKQQPFVMYVTVNDATVGFGWHRGRAWIQITEPMGMLVSTESPFHYDGVVKKASELVHPDLWPAFASGFKPENNSDTLF